MKTSRTKLDKAINDLIANPATIPNGWDCSRIDRIYLDRLDAVISELVDLSVQDDHKGRHGVKWAVRSHNACENGHIDMSIPKLGDDATPEQEDRASEMASANVEYAVKVLADITRSRRYRREVREAAE